MPRGVAAGLLVAHDSIRRRRSLAGSFIRSRAATRPRTMVNPRTAIGLSRVPMSDPAAPLTSTGVASGLNGVRWPANGGRRRPRRPAAGGAARVPVPGRTGTPRRDPARQAAHRSRPRERRRGTRPRPGAAARGRRRAGARLAPAGGPDWPAGARRAGSSCAPIWSRVASPRWAAICEAGRALMPMSGHPVHAGVTSSRSGQSQCREAPGRCRSA